jgi:hypothetical protein
MIASIPVYVVVNEYDLGQRENVGLPRDAASSQ